MYFQFPDNGFLQKSKQLYADINLVVFNGLYFLFAVPIIKRDVILKIFNVLFVSFIPEQVYVTIRRLEQ
jgi:hypothetical protein